MTILYKNNTIERQANSRYNKKWRYPKKVIEKLIATEKYILQATSLKDIFNYPSYRLHSLKGNRKDEWSLRLGNTGYRLTFIPYDDKDTPILNGDILSQCKTIKIIMITEVSNHYE